MGDLIKLCDDDNSSDELLENYKGKFRTVLIVGYDGEYVTLASNDADAGQQVLMLLDAIDLARE